MCQYHFRPKVGFLWKRSDIGLILLTMKSKKNYFLAIICVAAVWLLYFQNTQKQKQLEIIKINSKVGGQSKNSELKLRASSLIEDKKKENQSQVKNEVLDDAKMATTKETEDSVPWKDLNDNWMIEVKKHLLTVNPNGGAEMFILYTLERTKSMEEFEAVNLKIAEAVKKGPENKKLLDKLNQDAWKIRQEMQKNTKKIFGKYYKDIKEQYAEYEDSIQIYSRDIPISIEYGFDY